MSETKEIKYCMADWSLIDDGKVILYYPAHIRGHELELFFECFDLWKTSIRKQAEANDAREARSPKQQGAA